MNRLCNEVIQLIFFELNDPGPLTLISKRFYTFSQDPYVRARYFLARYGNSEAIYWALGRGRVLTERVLDILLLSGAHLSRYLVQVAMHYYFRTTTHFIKTTWVRSVSFPVFTYFLKIAAEKYGNIPCGKVDDDGSLFSTFLKESRIPSAMKSIQWEEIRDIVEKYKFIPFCNKDPIMTQYPLALAIEPRLLPLAEANGFHMDSKYRDFIFRKMFEKPAMVSDDRTDDIVHNVRELNRLDPKMFITRTVACEICMEAKINESGYGALKQLDKSGELRFELSTLVEELIKLFVRTRSITTSNTIAALRQLYADFPSADPTVRLVLILTVFLSDNCLAHTTPATLRSKLEPLGLSPLSRKDVYNVLVNPFVERYGPVIEYAKVEVGLSAQEAKELIEEVTVKCLEIGCKGKMLRKFLDGHPFLHETIQTYVMQRYQITLDDLPSHEDEVACAAFTAKLCRDFLVPRHSEGALDVVEENDATAALGDDHAEAEVVDEQEGDDGDLDEDEDDGMDEDVRSTSGELDLGHITQDTLSSMIRQDELAPSRIRRRQYYPFSVFGDGKLQYPSDPLQVGKWVKLEFGLKSAVTSVFLTHAIINNNSAIVHHYLGSYSESHVPITLMHFKLLARLGRAPNWCLYTEIENGVEFYACPEDYIRHSRLELKQAMKVKVKTEANLGSIPSSSTLKSFSTHAASKLEGAGSPRPKKRPRRMAAATVRSYTVPDSDDEAIADDYDSHRLGEKEQRKKRKVETNLQRWIKQLSVLLKDEQAKFREKKKRAEKSAPPGEKVRVPKSEFFKSLSLNLRNLRKVDQEKRLLLYGPEIEDEDYSGGDDDEYHYRSTRAKKRSHKNSLAS